MGLFKKSPKPVPATPPPTPAVTPADLTVAHRVTADFINVLGNDPQMRRAAYRIAQAGGGPADLETSLQLRLRTGDTGITRPWTWLAEVVDHPATAGNHELVAQIAFVVYYWHTELRGKLGMGDVSDMMLDAPPQDLVTRILSASVHHLQQVDRHAVFGQESLSIDTVRAMCCRYVLDVDPPAPEAVRRTAEQVLDAA